MNRRTGLAAAAMAAGVVTAVLVLAGGAAQDEGVSALVKDQVVEIGSPQAGDPGTGSGGAGSAAPPRGGPYDPSREREWLRSGPFEIDRSQYALGESVFVRMDQIASGEKGQIAFLRQLNSTHYSVYLTIPFDGSRPTVNQYFTPALSESRGICTIEDIAGRWAVVFRGTDYDNLSFVVSDSVFVPGREDSFGPVC